VSQPTATPAVTTTVRTGAESLVNWLEAMGVEVAFGCCGHGNVGFLDALVGSSIRYVSCPHEQIAVHAADAYYRVTHKIGVVVTTIGPGLANTLNGLLDAAADCSAVMVIAGDTIREYEGLDSFQEITRLGDSTQADIFRAAVKRVWKIRHPHMLLNGAARALNFALADSPGPVVLSVAMDLFSYAGEFDSSRYLNRQPTSWRLPGPESEIQRAWNLLSEAERPVVYAGGGVLASEATSELIRFAETLQIPVVTSTIGQSGFPNNHDLYAGNAGSVGTPAAHWALQTADVALALGTRFGEIDCSSWLPDRFLPEGCKLIQVDINPTEIGKTYPVEVGIVGDVRTVLSQALALHHPADDSPSSSARTARALEAKDRRARWMREFREIATNDDQEPLELEGIFLDLQETLPANAVVLVGASGSRHRIGQYYVFTEPRTHLAPSGHGTMGWPTAGVIGAKIGRPDVPVVAVLGDGDFRSLSEAVGAAVEANTSVVWLVLNNASYSVIGLYQHRHYGRVIGTDFEIYGEPGVYSPDYAKMAESYGAAGIRVDHREELRPALRTALAASRPVVIDVRTTPTPRYKASGYWDANRYLPRGWNIPQPDEDE